MVCPLDERNVQVMNDSIPLGRCIVAVLLQIFMSTFADVVIPH